MRRLLISLAILIVGIKIGQMIKAAAASGEIPIVKINDSYNAYKS